MNPTRFEPAANISVQTVDPYMTPNPGGRWVAASDYDALAARLAEAERLLEQWRHSFEYTSDAHASGRAACLATDATRKYFGMRPWMDWVAISGRKSYEQRPTDSAGDTASEVQP